MQQAPRYRRLTPSARNTTPRLQEYHARYHHRFHAAIADLIDSVGEARPVDIAGRRGVTQPTVAKALARLQRDGFVIHQGYGCVLLTESGRALAEVCRERHRIVVAFLINLGLDRDTAEQDAEGIEHHVSDRTLAAFRAALDEA